MPLNNQELALLIWILHFREQFKLKDISTVLKIPYWKVKDFASAFENDRLLKIEIYQKNRVLYGRDQKRLKSLLWKFLAWVGYWIPSSEPSYPILEPDISPGLKSCHDQCVKRLDRLRNAKGRSKSKITRDTLKPDTANRFDDFLNAIFGQP